MARTGREPWLLVRNFLEKRRYTWSDIEDFRIASELRYSTVHVVLRRSGELAGTGGAGR
jgi:hypothetical protein